MPFDLVKVRAQHNSEGYINYRKEMTNIVNREGKRGIFKGFWITFWRDVPSWGVYFATYEYLKTWEEKYNIRNTTPKLMLYGGIAGVVCWISTYPTDIVKTII